MTDKLALRGNGMGTAAEIKASQWRVCTDAQHIHTLPLRRLSMLPSVTL